MQQVIFLSIEEVVFIQERMIAIGGGSDGILDIELLHSAVERPKASFGGSYLYKSTLEMGAAMLQSLVKNHSFIDGNKRTAFFATLLFFEKNGLQFNIAGSEIVSFMVGVATKSVSVEKIAHWFEKRLA